MTGILNVNKTAAIDGSHPLAQINLQISAEETHFWEFEYSTIGQFRDKLSNLVRFKGTDDVLPKLQILELNDPAPAGKTKMWSGVMIVKGKLTSVVGYR